MARRRSNCSITICVIICIIIICILVQYIIQIKQENPIQPIQVQQVQIQNESKYDIAPQPLRHINIPTRGIPDDFQSIGVITIDDKILPIYGRRFDSDRWNYYTRTDTYNPVPIPKVIRCLEVNELALCNQNKEQGFKFDPQPQAVSQMSNPLVSLVQFDDVFCEAQTCSPIIGHVVVYRDANHITNTFVRTLAPYLEKHILTALGK